jgi:hypothetical protein
MIEFGKRAMIVSGRQKHLPQSSFIFQDRELLIGYSELIWTNGNGSIPLERLA